MRNVILTAALATAFAVPITAKGNQPADRDVLLKIEARWNKAVSDRDPATAAKIISDDFRYITPNGKVMDRAAVLKATGDKDYEIEPFQTEDVEVRVHGDTAVITGRFQQRGKYKGEAFTVQLRYTDVWTRTKAGWQAISAHSSVIR